MKENMTSTMWVASNTSSPARSYVQPTNEQNEKKDSQEHLVYGLKGIADFLHQSITTAWRLKKSGKYNEAISQRGRCIITDTDKLLELMRLDQATKQSDYIPYYNNVY